MSGVSFHVKRRTAAEFKILLKSVVEIGENEYNKSDRKTDLRRREWTKENGWKRKSVWIGSARN